MKINIEIYEEDEKMKFKYDGDKVADLNFEELVSFTKHLLSLDNFADLKEEDMIIKCSPEYIHYEKTLKSLFTKIQADEELLAILEVDDQNTGE